MQMRLAPKNTTNLYLKPLIRQDGSIAILKSQPTAKAELVETNLATST
jgi:hypothetical protein